MLACVAGTQEAASGVLGILFHDKHAKARMENKAGKKWGRVAKNIDLLK